MPAKNSIVTLTQAERKPLSEMIAKGTNAPKIKRAYILLAADASPEGTQMSDLEIQKAYQVSARTVERLRERFVVDGFEIALNGKPSDAPRPIKIDGDVEAHVIALACGEAPDLPAAGRWPCRVESSASGRQNGRILLHRPYFSRKCPPCLTPGRQVLKTPN